MGVGICLCGVEAPDPDATHTTNFRFQAELMCFRQKEQKCTSPVVQVNVCLQGLWAPHHQGATIVPWFTVVFDKNLYLTHRLVEADFGPKDLKLPKPAPEPEPPKQPTARVTRASVPTLHGLSVLPLCTRHLKGWMPPCKVESCPVWRSSMAKSRFRVKGASN